MCIDAIFLIVMYCLDKKNDKNEKASVAMPTEKKIMVKWVSLYSSASFKHHVMLAQLYSTAVSLLREMFEQSF